MYSRVKEHKDNKPSQGKYDRARYKGGHVEDLPSRTKMRPERQDWDTCSNTYLRPIERYLMSRIGNVWDDVYSDLCKRFDVRSHNGYAVIDYLNYAVETHVFENGDGIPRCSRGWKVWGFYVYDGVLCFEKREKFKSKEVNPLNGDVNAFLKTKYGYSRWMKKTEEDIASDAKLVCKIGDQFYVRLTNKRRQRIWYEAIMTDVNDQEKDLKSFSLNDLILGELSNCFRISYMVANELVDKYGSLRYASDKRQLSSEEIRKLNLPR